MFTIAAVRELEAWTGLSIIAGLVLLTAAGAGLYVFIRRFLGY